MPLIKSKKRRLQLKPQDISPMLSEIGDDPFDDDNWIFEIKHDGYRVLAICDGKGSVELFSRNHLSFNHLYAPVLKELKKLKHAAVLDGEIVIEDSKGISRFQLLQNYQKTGSGDLKYYVFDLINLEGTDITGLPLRERKELLQALLDRYDLKNIYYSQHVEGKGKSFYNKAIREKREGIMAKDATSPYRQGRRTREWLKIKINQEEEAIIAGITSPKGGRLHFGSLLLARYEKGKLKYIGNCGTGFTDSMLRELYSTFKKYFIKQSPFSEKVAVKGTVTWMKPVLVCQVKFTEWTHGGQMRHPVFLGLRMDKKAPEVMTPQAAKNPSKKEGDTQVNIGKTIVNLTNQNKIYFPADKITKGDIVQYYMNVADIMLPYLKDRPQSMNRFPNGITGESFYQKDVDTDKIPSWLKTEKVFSESNNEYIDYLICNDKATLVYMANLGCIEINPWNSRITKPDHPDWMVIDLDPEKIAFREVVRTANEVRKLMEELEIDSYCKTSGATGLHIYIPLGAKYDYDIVKNFAQLIARTVNVRLPDITSIERSPSKRQNRVYLDFLQNRRGQTLAAPYSVRPKPGATVSTPLEWKEVNARLDPSKFTIKNTLKRIEKKGDLWHPVIKKGVNLKTILKKLNQ